MNRKELKDTGYDSIQDLFEMLIYSPEIAGEFVSRFTPRQRREFTSWLNVAELNDTHTTSQTSLMRQIINIYTYE